MFHVFVNIGLEVLEILLGKATVVRETHPKVTIFVEIPVLVEKIGIEHEAQRPVDGYRVEKHPERVGADVETVRVEIVAHVIGKTGAYQHHSVGLTDVKRVCRGGDCGSELHILLFGYQ